MAERGSTVHLLCTHRYTSHVSERLCLQTAGSLSASTNTCMHSHYKRQHLLASQNSGLGRQVRVMPRCWFALLRFWLRVDGVQVRLYEARWLAELGTGAIQIQRELRRCEGTFADLAAAGAPPARVRAACPAAVTVPLEGVSCLHCVMQV